MGVTGYGNLRISTEVIAKIAKTAALEVKGVAAVANANGNVSALLNRVNMQSPVTVLISDDVAEITVSIYVKYGSKVTAIAQEVQKNVKSSVQNMTSIAVSKVNVVVTGLKVEDDTAE